MSKNVDRIRAAANSLAEYLDGIWDSRDGIQAIIDSLDGVVKDMEEKEKMIAHSVKEIFG